MFNFFKKTQNPEDIAKTITEKVAGTAFNFFRQQEFRQQTNLTALDQTEQDRIFNELVANGLVLGILMFDFLSTKTKKDRSKQFYEELKIELISRYGNWLRELGTPEQFCNLWKDLIQMRAEEYSKDYRKYRKEIDDPFKENPWVFVVAIGCHNHIRRGKSEPDELFKLILRWILETAKTISKITLKSI